MKTFISCLWAFILSIAAANAQLNYNFTALSGTYTPISGGNIAELDQDGSGYSETDEGFTGAIPIGFTFIYDGVPYNTMYANSNGFASFNPMPLITNTRLYDYYTVDLTEGPYSDPMIRPILAPLWDDMDVFSYQGIKYQTTGSSPNRVFTLEWNDVYWDQSATEIGISFQIKLFENTNVIEFHYQQKPGAVITTGASIGITGTAIGTGNFLSLNNSSASPTASSEIDTYNINIKPATNQVYRFSPINNQPILAAIPNLVVNELSNATFTASGTDPDGSAQILSYSLADAPDGASIDPVTGVFTWTPTEAQGAGVYPFKVRVSDNGSPILYAEQTVTITVNEVNTAPVLAPITNKTVNELTQLTFTAIATDADLPAQGIVYSFIDAPPGSSINAATGVFTWTPTEAQGGSSYTFTLRATDNATSPLSSDQQVTITVNEVNAAPVLAPIANRTVNELTPFTFTATATDADLPAQNITYSLIGAPAGAAMNATTGVFNWTPSALQGPGTYSFTVRATDNGTLSMSSEQTITITVSDVNTAPVLPPLANRTVNELSPLTFTATATDPDVPAQAITYSLVGAPEGATINTTTGVFTWTPSETQGPGTYTFTVKASDNATLPLAAEQSVTITVNEVNAAPVLAPIASRTVNEVTPLTFTATATDADLPAQNITYSLIGAPTGASVNATSGVFNWTPTEAQGPGTYIFTVKATDNATPQLSSEQTVTITVNEVNAAPVLAPIANRTVNELTPLTFTAIATDADLPAQTITYSLVGAPTGTAMNATTGVFNWTPSAAQGPGTYSFTVRATDNGTPSISSEQTVTITVSDVNTAPVLAPIANRTVNELTPLTFTATATDADLPAQTITYSLVGAPDGAAIIATTGVFTWTPTEAQGPATYTFTVKATDNATPSLSATQSITVTVNEVNAAPVLAPIANRTGNELTALTFTATATDADLPAQTITYSLVGAPAGALINTTTGVFTWTPPETQGPGTYTFTVKATDNATLPLSAEQTVTITVNEVNAAPALAPIASRTVNELTPLTFTATATDADLPAQTITYSLVGAPTGASVNATTGIFNWTPTEAQGPGTYSFTVRATDNATLPLFAEQTVTITVNEVNAAPVLAPIANRTVNEVMPLTFTATATDADLPAQTITYSLVGAPAGALINTTTGVFSWTPSEAQGGSSFTFTVRATDNASAAMSSEQSVTVTVNETNTAPVLASIGNQTVNALSTLTFTAKATDSDLPAQTIAYSLTGTVPAGASINRTTGAFTWTPTAAQGPANYTFTIVATDNGTPASTSEETISVMVLAAPVSNTAPILAAIGNRAVNELIPLTFTASATDADLPAQTITYSLVGAPAGASINAATGIFSWTPTEAQGPNTYVFKVSATDNGSPSLSTEEQITITVNEVNLAPVLAPIANRTVNELTPLTFTATATDADLPAQTITYSLIGAPAGAAMNATTGVFSWTPTEAQAPGTYTFTVKATDNATSQLSSQRTVRIAVNEVNAAPALAPIASRTVNELSPLTFTATATDPDVPAQAITYSLVGAPEGATINATTGVFTWTPTETQGPGTYTFTVKASDNATLPLAAEQSVTITVNEVNAAPVLAPIASRTVNEVTPLTFTATATDADLPAQNITYSLIGAPTGASVNATSGVFNWTPTEAQGPGTYIFTVKATDNATPQLSSEQTVTITVNEVNAAPVLAPIANRTVNELTPLTFTAIATDADLPAQTITYSLVGAPTGTAMNATTGVFNWTPSAAQGPGTYSFTVRATDNGTPSISSEQTVTITVSDVNTAPVLAPIANRTVNELTPLTFTATATDADLPAQTITYSLVGAPDGAAIIATTGVFTWTPTEAQGPATYTFTVKATDNATPSLSATQSITVTVNEVNAAPVLAPIANRTGNELTALTFTATATDADLPAQTITYSLVGAPAGALINTTTGVFTWTPPETQGPGTYTFTVKATDNATLPLSAEQTVTITVNEVNAAPALAPIASRTVNELTPLTFTATATDADLPAQTITYSLVGAPTGASVNATTGIFNWTPTEAQGPGTYSFTVRATDNATLPLFAEQTVTITVNEVNAAPVLAPIANRTVNEVMPLTFTATATDADLPAQTITYSLVGAPAGALINTTTGVFSWTPSEAQGGSSFTFTVRATDNASAAMSSEQSVTVTVNETNTAPVLASIGNQTVNALSTLTFTAKATDSDLPAQTIAYSLTGTIPAGASINRTTGAFTWTPTVAQKLRSYTFGIKATDNGSPALNSEEIITVSVVDVKSSNVAPVLMAIGNRTVNELTLLTLTAKATDANGPSQKLKFTLEGAVPSGAKIDQKTGVFRWTPSELQGPKVYTFRVRVTDDGKPALFAEEQITVTVKEVIEITKTVKIKVKQKCLPLKCKTLSGSTHGLSKPFTYLWSTGATTRSIKVCPTSDVTYRLTITGAYETRQTNFVISVKDEDCNKKPKKIKNHKNETKGKKADAIVTLLGNTVSVETNNTPKITIYPNPSSNKRVHVSITGDGKGLKTGHLYITDLLGRNVYTQKVVNREFDINLSNQSKGVYLVRIKLNNRETTTKVILE